MFKLLENYKYKGKFVYAASDNLIEKCNAPSNCGGVYIIFHGESILYIGSSGRRRRNGIISIRTSGLGGMKDRIVNGYHPKFGKKKRKLIFPIIMEEQGIDKLVFKWYVTFDDDELLDYPPSIEKILLKEYYSKYDCYPSWHK